MQQVVPIRLLAALLAGCGGDKRTDADADRHRRRSRHRPRHEDPTSTGYSQGVRDYYGAGRTEPDGRVRDATSRPSTTSRRGPPRPSSASTITLTGSNIGVRLAVTVTKVETVGDKHRGRARAREHRHHRPTTATFARPTLTYADGEPLPVARGVKATCSNGFDDDRAPRRRRKTTGCLLFPGRDAEPERFQLALETVPADAGGIWNLG